MTAPEHELVPVLVHGLGRSGTTLLMQLLGTSRQVAFDREPPCERRYLTYLLRLCRLLDPGHPHPAGWDSDRLMHDVDGPVGPPPWSDLGLVAPAAGEQPLAMQALRSLWQRFSDLAARNTAPEAPESVRYYAEKAPRWVVRALPTLGGGRAVHLVRDPRDVWLSANAFNQKRGFAAFGREPGMSDDDYLARFLATVRVFLGDVVAQADSAVSLRVRYEDLVADLGAEAARIGAWLGVSLDAGAVRQGEARVSGHMTSASVRASVGRWRSELPAPVAQRFTDELGGSLQILGYA